MKTQGCEAVLAGFARKLERERDEARNIARWLDDYEAMEALLCEMQGLRDELVDVKRERDEQTAQMCQAIGYLSTIAEDCEAWLNGESDEPSMDFIKAVRDYARKAING